MIKPHLQLSTSGRRTPPISREQTANRGQRIRNKITTGRIRLYQQRSAACNGQLPMQIYRGYPAFYPVVYAQATRRNDEKLGRDFHRGRRDATHVLPIDTNWPFWMRVSIKFIHGQAVDNIAEIRWVIALRYVGSWRDPLNLRRQQ